MPLSDVRVLDLTRLLPGPYATMHLADLGAEVIKVESPLKPDYLRFMPPMHDGCHLGFGTLNRSKKSMVVRLDTEPGQSILRKLASRCDVLVESFRAGYLARFELDYASLSRDNPGLVYCSMTAYGQKWSEAGHDINFLARSGLGWAVSKGDEPVLPRVQLGDMVGGMAAVCAILAALHRRSRTGEGGHLDLALTDAAYHLTTVRSAEGMVTESSESPEQDTLAGSSPAYRYYRCRDGGWLAVGALEEGFREKLIGALELEVEADELLAPVPKLHRRLEEIFATRDRQEWMEKLGPLDACIEPVLDPREAVEQPWFGERFPNRWVQGALGEPVPQPPGLLDATFPSGPRFSAVPPGAHTEELLRWLGFSDTDIDTLENEGHIGRPG